jgi:nucleoside-diphosphate-sugar epimerase
MMEYDKKALIIGGLGFIGKNLYLHLTKKGIKAHILSNVSLEKKDPFIESFNLSNLIVGDILDQKLLDSIISDYDYVFYLAALSGAAESLNRPVKDMNVNLNGVLNLLNSCKNYNPEIQIFFPSSRLVYGKPKYNPVDEKHSLNPESIYAIHKLTAEYYFLLYYKLYNLRVIIFRISNVYGPYQKPEQQSYGILNKFIYQSLKGENLTLYGDGKQRRDFLYIDDLLDLYEILLDNKNLAGNIYNIGYGSGISLHNIIINIKKVTPGLSYKFIPWPVTEKKIETGDYVSDISLIKKHTHWQPKIGFEEGITRTMKFYHRFYFQ